MTENYQEPNNLSSLSQLILMGTATVLATIPELAPVAGGLNILLFNWQKDNLDKFIIFCQNKFKAIDAAKLDKAALEPDEFKSLIFDFFEAATKTHSESKLEIFANVLANSITLPKSKITKKQLLFRIIRDLSEEEMEVLRILVNKDGDITSGVALELGIDIEDALILCQGLQQFNLVRPPDREEYELIPANSTTSGSPKPLRNSTGSVYVHWRVTRLAKELISWCSKS